MEILNACTDKPSSLDYSYLEIVPFGITLNKEVVKYIPPTIYNQFVWSDTHMACTRYGMAHIVNAQNYELSKGSDYKFEEIDPRPLWITYTKENPSAIQVGATLQSALEQFKKNKLITGYAVANSEEEMKRAITFKNFIYTGSLNGDWNKVRSTGVYGTVSNAVIGHAFCIVGYTKEGWVAINSEGPNNGEFTIPYEFTNTLFNRYACFDSNDEDYLNTYHEKLMENITIEDAKEALLAKIWNGERPQEPASRQETAAMIVRAIKQLQNQ